MHLISYLCKTKYLSIRSRLLYILTSKILGASLEKRNPLRWVVWADNCLNICLDLRTCSRNIERANTIRRRVRHIRSRRLSVRHSSFSVHAFCGDLACHSQFSHCQNGLEPRDKSLLRLAVSSATYKTPNYFACFQNSLLFKIAVIFHQLYRIPRRFCEVRLLIQPQFWNSMHSVASHTENPRWRSRQQPTEGQVNLGY